MHICVHVYKCAMLENIHVLVLYVLKCFHYDCIIIKHANSTTAISSYVNGAGAGTFRSLSVSSDL